MICTVSTRRSATGLLIPLLSVMVSLTTAFRSHQETLLTDAYLRGIMNHLGDKMLLDAAPEGYIDYPLPNYEDVLSPSQQENEMKEYEDNLSESVPRERTGLGLSLRDQDQSISFQHQRKADSITKRAGEEKVRVKPTSEPGSSGSSSKTENVLPAYCNPPNPCPIGYTGDDGCLEEFENTAAFSREYQAAQDCMCDTEHMFDCPASNANKNVNAKNRATATMVDTAIRKIMSDFQKDNPYLQGDKLPIAAKKGNRAAV
nr:EOG090X0DEG [Eurycercus lamellatus]